MSLHDKLKRVKDKGEEKTIALRMPKSKVLILEKLADYYGLNTSALIREMIDEAIMKLQKELIVFPDELGVEVTQNGEKRLITYFPDVVAVLTNDSMPYSFSLEDCECNEKLMDIKVKEDARLSVEKGLSMGHSGLTPYSREEFNFIREEQKK